MPRLDGLRAARDRHRRRGAVGRGARIRGALGVDARLRRGDPRARADGPDRRRPHARPARCGLGGPGRARVPRLVGAERRRS